MEEKEERMENTVTEEVALEGQKTKKSGSLFYVVLAIIFVAFMGFRVIWASNFMRVEVSGASMNQTLKDKEVLLMDIVKDEVEAKSVQRGEIIVVDVSPYGVKDAQGNQVSYIIKRLIAVEGDKVKCKDGQISICYRGTEEYVELDEPYAYYGGMFGYSAKDYDFKEYVVGENEIFFLGDNRLNSVDSRYQEMGGSHLVGSLYKTSDIFGVVPQWAVDNRELFNKLFFL